MFHVDAKIIVLFAIALAAGSPVALAQPGVPNSPPPEAGRVVIQDDQLLITQSFTRWEAETRARTVTVNGQQQEQTYTVMRPVMERKNRQMFAGGYRVMTVGGERLSEEQAAERLTTPTDVLISTSGKLLEPAYRDLYLPETLIVYLRSDLNCAPVPEVAPPPPAEGAAPAPTALKAPAELPPPTKFPEPPPLPKFPELPLPKGPPPAIGLAVNPVFDGKTTADDKVRLSVIDWRTVMEEKPVAETFADDSGNLHKVVKMQAVNHWLGQGRSTDVPLAELALVDRQGKPLPPAARAKLAGGMFPVLLMSPGLPVDDAHFQHFRPEVPIALAELPPGEGQSFPNMLPPHETYAQVKGDWLFLYKPVWEQKIEKVPVTVVEDGKPVSTFQEKIITLTKTVGIPYPLKTAIHVKVADAAGKPVDRAALAERLAKESPVLAWDNGWPVGDIYLAPVKPDSLTLLLTPWAPSEPGEAPPPAPAPELPATGLPPRFALAQLHQPGNLLVLREPQPNTAHFAKQVSKTVDGKVMTETVYETRIVTHWYEHGVSAEDYRLTGIDGQPLSGDAAWGRLNKETMVLIGDQGKKVDPAWLAIYKPDAVIVYLRPRFGGYGPAAAPAPAAPPPPPPDGVALPQA